MKLIINTSTLSASGATQVSTSFIYECRNFESHEYHVFLSETVGQQVNKADFPENFHFYDFERHPLSIKDGFKSLKRLKKLEKSIQPDVIFSIFGPSWWSPRAPHLMGYAYPHYVYPESPLFKLIPFKERIKLGLFKKIHLYFLKRNGKYYVSETQDVTARLRRLITSLPEDNFFSVGNTCNSFYYDFKDGGKVEFLPSKEENEFRFLSLCTYHLHKNLRILNKVIPLIKEKGKNIRFVLTLDESIFQKEFTEEAKKSIVNIGRIPVNKCPQLYSECDALFLPTLLECFSANYPEAMVMKKPITTSNLSFATSVCKDAALYFDPLNENDIVETLLKVVKDNTLRQRLVQRGRSRIKELPTAPLRAKEYLEICKKIKG